MFGAERVDGQELVIGGTSAVAPLYAALIARINGKLGRHVGLGVADGAKVLATLE